MGSPIVLLPPSEGKSPGGRRGHLPDRFAAELCIPRTVWLPGGPREGDVRSDGVGEEQASPGARRASQPSRRRDRAPDRRRRAAPSPRGSGTAELSGEALDPSTLAPTVRARILVPSALYGITSAQDYIADYRLGMQSNLPGVGNLARFWRPMLTDLIRPSRRRTTVIDLLTAEHRSAIEWQRFGPVVRIDFVEAQGRGAAGHIAKAAKGRFARHVIDHGIEEALSFADDGWKVLRTDTGFQIRSLK